MNLKVVSSFVVLATLVLAGQAHAQLASGTSFEVASAQPAARFMSLQPARDGVNSSGAVVKSQTSSARSGSAMRSDNQALRKGFMRLDRNMMVVTARQPRSNVIVTRPQATRNTTEKDKEAQLFAVHGSVRGHSWPVAKQAKQYISSGYGMRKDPFHGKQRFHGGIDIAADSGTAVLASAAGIVSAVGAKGGFGNHVSIDHADGTQTMYGHLSREEVRVGQRVRQGQVIGRVGSTGRSTGAHLDYRIKKNGQTVDPLKVLARSTMPVMSRMVAANDVRVGGATSVDARGARRLPSRPMVIQVK